MRLDVSEFVYSRSVKIDTYKIEYESTIDYRLTRG